MRLPCKRCGGSGKRLGNRAYGQTIHVKCRECKGVGWVEGGAFVGEPSEPAGVYGTRARCPTLDETEESDLIR